MKTALIIGASRGLGLGLVQEYTRRGWKVTATVRGADTPLHKAKVPGLEIEALDITAPDQIKALQQKLQGRVFDLLFINAGIANKPEETVAQISTAEFNRVMVTNALSPLRAVDALLSLVRPGGTVAVMTSVLGSAAASGGGAWREVYSASKAALNMLLRAFAAGHGPEAYTWLAMHPGWVRTDMGGAGATLDVDTSVRGMADTIEKRSRKGGIAFVDHSNKEIPW